MIHRIDRVNPDVDDRVIKPNEARMAVNLRFGASTEDTNLSGGTLVLGNTELPFTPPAGTNKVVGVYADLESRNVFFALYNNQGENTAAQHGIYRISGADNSVQPIVQGAWLNFQSDDAYNVSITGVDGKLYWTDNVNEPRMVNVEKGIRTQAGDTTDVYPIAAVQDWFYSQIKRPPGQALEISPILSTEDVSTTYNNKTLTNTGLQFSYYYVYDNFEESRLAPFTFNSYAVYNVTLTIPEPEFSEYTAYTQLIKNIVIVVRNGNDGVWRELVYEQNTGTKKSWFFNNVLTAVKNIVASDIVDARFDSVPLRSVTNEIAQNKINHGNYRVDYEYQEDNPVTIEAAIRPLTNLTDFPLQDAVIRDEYRNNSFLPWGRYAIGVEFVDNYGRTYPVTNSIDVVAPFLQQQFETRSGQTYLPGSQGIELGTSNNLFDVTVTGYNQSNLQNTVAEYKIKGSLPSWVTRVNVVRSKAKNIVLMHQSIGPIFHWYETEKQEPRFFSWVYPRLTYYDIPVNGRTNDVNVIYNAGEINKKFTFKGFVIKYPLDAPFTETDNLYVTIYRPTYKSNVAANPANPYQPTSEVQNDAGVYAQVLKFKVYLIGGGYIYLRKGDEIIKSEEYPASLPNTSSLNLTPWSFPVAVFDPTVSSVFAAQDPAKWYPLLWNFTLTQEKNIDDQIVYTTQDTYTRSEYQQQIANNGFVKGWLKGDGVIARTRKTYPVTGTDIKLYVFPGMDGASQPIIIDKTVNIESFEWSGDFISMSPRDIYSQEWNQNIGQLNTVNYKDARNRAQPSNICFSGNIIQGTQVNGLNKFNSLDFRQAPAENGPITSLVTTNATQREPGVLLAIGTYGVSSFYYDAIQLTNVDGTNNVTTTDSYLASQRPLLGQYGTARPMSVTKTPLGTVYWWSDVVNDLIRYTNAGLERLGNTFSFANYLRRTYNENPLLITWYDQVTDEINLLGAGVRAAVFSERYKTFQGERDYFLNGITPERAIGLPTKQFWFVNGRVWMADVNQSGVDDNFIFGAYRNPNLTIITNESPAAVKRWNQVKVFGNRPSSTILSTTGFDTITDETLTSFIAPGYYIQRKGDWEAAIRRASNTEGGLLAGKLMESRIIYSNFAFSAEGFDKLNFIEIKSNVSIVQ
jgi:hypothetical protein